MSPALQGTDLLKANGPVLPYSYAKPQLAFDAFRMPNRGRSLEQNKAEPRRERHAVRAIHMDSLAAPN